MPATIYGNVDSSIRRSTADLRDKNFGYNYPRGLDLRPGYETHDKIQAYLMQRAREGYDIIKTRHSSWEAIDKSLTSYISPDDRQELDTKDETELNKDIKIVVPVTYATLDTLLTFMVAAFLRNPPIWKFDGVGPEDTSGAALMEHIIQLHVKRFKVALSLYYMWRNGFAYNVGPCALSWGKQFGLTIENQPIAEQFSLFDSAPSPGPPKTTRVIRPGVLFEGNKLESIDPFRYIPDGNFPVHDVQRGEYCGWVSRENLFSLLRREDAGTDGFFNVDYLREIGDGRTSLLLNETLSAPRDKHGTEAQARSQSKSRPIDVIYMYCDIIPNELGLGREQYPEKWAFAIASDTVVIKAEPLGLLHDMFPVVVCTPDPDGVSIAPISRLEAMQGMQRTVDWFLTSHVANVKKSINDMIIVDPDVINIDDLLDPKPGKLIRVRSNYWGRDAVKNAVHQFNVADVTANHVRDASFLMDIIQRTSGAVDSLQGIQRTSGERVTATESRGTRTSALSRLEKAGLIVSVQAMQDIGIMFAMHTQQLMTQETYVKATGRHRENLVKVFGQEQVLVRPSDLSVHYDLDVGDGLYGGGEFIDQWLQAFQIISSQPETLVPMFDMGRIFLYIAQQMGAKNISDFVRNVSNVSVEVQPTETVAGQVQAGNLIPSGVPNGAF